MGTRYHGKSQKLMYIGSKAETNQKNKDPEIELFRSLVVGPLYFTRIVIYRVPPCTQYVSSREMRKGNESGV